MIYSSAFLLYLKFELSSLAALLGLSGLPSASQHVVCAGLGSAPTGHVKRSAPSFLRDPAPLPAVPSCRPPPSGPWSGQSSFWVLFILGAWCSPAVLRRGVFSPGGTKSHQLAVQFARGGSGAGSGAEVALPAARRPALAGPWPAGGAGPSGARSALEPLGPGGY